MQPQSGCLICGLVIMINGRYAISNVFVLGSLFYIAGQLSSCKVLCRSEVLAATIGPHTPGLC